MKAFSKFVAWLIVLLPLWLFLAYGPIFIKYLMPHSGWTSYLMILALPFQLGFLLLGALTLPAGILGLLKGEESPTGLPAFGAFLITMLVFFWVRPSVGEWVWSHPPGGNLARFDRQVWLSGESGPSLTPRQTMVVDVIANCVNGRTRKEIEELLGPPSEHRSDQGMFYKLGPHRGAAMDPDAEYLKITFDGGGRGKGEIWQE